MEFGFTLKNNLTASILVKKALIDDEAQLTVFQNAVNGG